MSLHSCRLPKSVSTFVETRIKKKRQDEKGCGREGTVDGLVLSRPDFRIPKDSEL